MIITPIVAGGKDPQGQGFYRQLSGSRQYTGGYLGEITITVDCGFIPMVVEGYCTFSAIQPPNWNAAFQWDNLLGGHRIFPVSGETGASGSAMSVTVNGNSITFNPINIGYKSTGNITTVYYCISGRAA